MKLIPTAIAQQVARQALLSQKHAPAILFGTGILGMIGSTAMACRATLKLEEVATGAQHDMDQALRAEADPRNSYSETDLSEDIRIIRVRTAVSIVKLYTPAVLLGVAGIGCLTKSHKMLNARNEALVAAYAAVSTAFNEYRGRVIEKYGPDEDRELRYETEVVESKNDKGKLVKSVQVAPGTPSGYARFFDELNANWNKEPEYNLNFITNQQNYANDMLRSRGFVFLNEVYKMLGIEESRAGQVVGWIIGPDSDNYIDFGVYDPRNEKAIDFVNGREGSILLDFNVDGTIIDKVHWTDRGASWQS